MQEDSTFAAVTEINISDLSNDSLLENLKLFAILLDSHKELKNIDHLYRLATRAYNEMLSLIPKEELTRVQVLKFNLLGAAIDGRFNLGVMEMTFKREFDKLEREASKRMEDMLKDLQDTAAGLSARQAKQEG